MRGTPVDRLHWSHGDATERRELVSQQSQGFHLHQARRGTRGLQHERPEAVVAFVARSSADEWDSIIPYDRSQPD